MDFVFMLTRMDRTIADALDVLDDIREVGLRHIGFKDVGIEPAAAHELHRRIKAMGATSYLEVVSTTPDACLQSARVARELGVDRLLGGTQLAEILEIIGGSNTKYLPFPGQPFGHPTKLRGSPADVATDCARFAAAGAAGVDLLAYRSIEADPIELVRAARRATKGTVLVAGGVSTPAQVRALRDAGADAFTVGSAVFDGSFAPHVGSMRSQLKAVLDAAA
jgi:Histidine biosynthesis protein